MRKFFPRYNLLIAENAVNQHTLNRYQYRFCNGLDKYPGVIPDSLDMRNIRQINFGPMHIEKDYESWIKNESKMAALSSLFGCKFISILEPMICSYIRDIPYDLTELMNHDNKGENQRIILQSQKKFVIKVNDNFKYDYFFDMNYTISGIGQCFFDNIHMNDQGSKIIAKHIFDILLKSADIDKWQC